MQPFTVLKAIAAPLPMVNVDTDMIIPKQHLKTIKRTGLGRVLFDELRFTPEGREIEHFVLNRDPWRKAGILVAGENFGCGSSREHAPWALADFGIRCIIAPSFADIFFNNSAKNGILLIKLPQAQVDALMQDASTGVALAIDLPHQSITRPSGVVIPFEIEPFRKKCLVEGLDDIGLTLEHEAAITIFETSRKAAQPWL